MPEELDKSSYSSMDKAKGERPKEIKRITTGKKKRNFLRSLSENFLGDTGQSVGEYILFDVLIPAAKSTISDIVTNGIEMILYGEPRRNKRGGTKASYVSYSDYYNRDREIRPDRNRSRVRFDDVVIPSRREAEEVLGTLADIITEYGAVSIAEFYDMVGFHTEWSDHKYGWQNLSQTTINRVREGYVLDLPRPVALD